MKTETDDLTTSLNDAYDQLYQAHSWDRDCSLKIAKAMAAKHGQQVANAYLAQQIRAIIAQAKR